MEILLISYGDIEYDGRLRGLISVFSEIGQVHAFTRGSNPLNDYSEICNVFYPRFIIKSVGYAKRIGRIDLLVLDNRKATIPGMIIQKKIHPTTTIQDCRELYLINEVKHFIGKVGCLFEMMMLKKADIVICANQERAKIMKKEYGLNKEPITYENLRQLQYESDSAFEAAKNRLISYLHEGEYRVISSSGCSLNRTNDVLVKSMSRVEKPCRLFLVGDSSEKEVASIKSIINDYNLSNVEILGQLNQTELKFLISQSHIGIVNYGQYDTNNRLCASGKLYEFLYEGIPVVTTSNPPLRSICESYRIGIADDAYYDGINRIISNYQEYKENVRSFIQNNTIEDNDRRLIQSLKNIIIKD